MFIFFISFINSFIISKFLSVNKYIIDEPNHRSSHDKPIPRSGGIAIFATFIISSLIFLEIKEFILIGSLFFFLGLYDDIKNISNKIKLVLIFFLSIIIIQDFSLLGLFILFFFVSTIISFNFIDGLDGLSSLLAISSLSFLYFLSSENNIFILITIAAICSFLIFNRNPAKLFLGDSGSTFIGFLLAYFSYKAFINNDISLFQSLVIHGVYLFDIFFVILFRLSLKKSPFEADRRHIHHLTYNQLRNVNLTVFTLVMIHLTILFLTFFF